MKLLIQRVNQAQVSINGQIHSKIGVGYLIYLGISHKDINPKIDKIIIDKILNLRLFEDENGKINKNIYDINGEILIVSNFTLYGNTKKGTRPNFTEAAKVEDALTIYNRFIDNIKSATMLNIQEGQFQAMMEVNSINNGPVNIIIEKEID
jgi:D-tyrosyl-tRNA(Tyr) deacylase